MKRKFENIAIVLFSALLITSILGVMLLQKNMSSVLRTNNISEISLIISDHVANMIAILGVILVISISSLILVFQSVKKLQRNKFVKVQEENYNIDLFDQEDNVPTSKNGSKQSELKHFEELKNEINSLNNNESLDLKTYCDKLLTLIARKYEIFQGLIYTLIKDEENQEVLIISGSYAFNKNTNHQLKLGEGLAGQVAKAKRTVNIKQIPAGYIKAISGLGESSPSNLLICAIIDNDETLAVIELATFKEFSKEEESYFASLGPLIKDKIIQLS